VHLLPGQAVREAVQHARPLAQRPHDAVADAQVVVDQVELGQAELREVHPVRIRDADGVLPGINLDRG
jgi:hypothetical protein